MTREKTMRNRLSTLLGFGILTLLLTAGAAQSLSGSNTVFTDDIANGHVRSADILNNSVTTSDVLNNSLTGSDLLTGSVTGSDVNEASLVLTCPTVAPPNHPLTRVGDICYGTAVVGANLDTALNNCAAAKLRLPTYAEARLVANQFNPKPHLWTQDIFHNGTEYFAITAFNNSWDAEEEASVTPQYRCVTTVGARP